MRYALNMLLMLAALLPFAARADMGTNVGEIHATGIAAYRGRPLAVFYVAAREAMVGGLGQTLKVRAVKTAPVRVEISSSGNAVIPRAFVPVSGFTTLNYIVFAIPAPENQGLFLRNLDGTYPKDPRVPNDDWIRMAESGFTYEHMWYMSMTEFERLKTAQGDAAAVNVDFSGRSVISSALKVKTTSNTEFGKAGTL